MIEYLSAARQDLDEIEALYRRYLDNGTSLRGRLETLFSRRSTLSCKAVDTETGHIIGLAVYEEGLIFSCDYADIRHAITDALGKDAIYYTGESLIVEKAYRDAQISRNLNMHIHHSMQEAARQQSHPIFVLHEMWVYPDGKTPAYDVVNTIYGIHRDFGVFPQFYREYYKNGHLCPVCGEDCICSARITISKIE